jgi:ATP-dependent RNA helicase DDX10/DBP4
MMEIHGRQKQMKRTAIYFEFVERKNAYLFATDIASRGMDFPAVDWVINVDIPEDTDTYIHRVGRTARYKFKGNSLLMVLPSEIKFVDKLKALKIDMKKLKTNPNRQLSITSALQRINAENSDLMHLAQKAFVCYIRSVFKNGDKEVFDVKKINHEALAESFGLVTIPKIEFVAGDEVKKNKKSKLEKLREKIKQRKKEKQIKKGETVDEDDKQIEEQGESEPEEEEDQEEPSDEEQKSEPEDEEDLFTLKRRIDPDEKLDENDNSEEDIEPIKVFSKNAVKKIKKGGISQGKNKIYFGAGGKPMTSLEYHIQHDTLKEGEHDGDDIAPEEYFNKVKMSLSQNKAVDEQIALDRLKNKRQKRKRQRAEREEKKQMKRGKYQEEVNEDGEGEDNQQNYEGEGDERSDEEM